MTQGFGHAGAEGEHQLKDTEKTESIILRWVGDGTAGIIDHKSWGYPVDDGNGVDFLNEIRRRCCRQKHSIASKWNRE